MKNREIKFKIWDGHLKIWVSNYGMGPNNRLTTGNEKRFHMMQYTGIKDRDGDEIYEGNLIKIGAEPGTYEVRFHAAAFLVYDGEKQIGLLGELKMCFLKVVGNIYE